jgi:hypothetical protein
MAMNMRRRTVAAMVGSYMGKSLLAPTLTFLLMAGSGILASARTDSGDQQALKTAKKSEFATLRDERTVLLSEFQRLQSQRTALQEEITQERKNLDSDKERSSESVLPERSAIDADIDNARKQLDPTEKRLQQEREKPKQNMDEIRRLDSLVASIKSFIQRKTSDLANYPRRVEQQDKLKKQVEEREAKIVNDQRQLTVLDNQLNDKQQRLYEINIDLDSLLNRIEETNSFRREVSLVFAALVGLVICGFFWIALTDVRVRMSIFSHEAGIQFVTLFALVIAIILFGVVEILEGKELSALLGGLSGYILGRGTGAAEGQPRPAEPQPVQSPPAQG